MFLYSKKLLSYFTIPINLFDLSLYPQRGTLGGTLIKGTWTKTSCGFNLQANAADAYILQTATGLGETLISDMQKYAIRVEPLSQYKLSFCSSRSDIRILFNQRDSNFTAITYQDYKDTESPIIISANNQCSFCSFRFGTNSSAGELIIDNISFFKI